MRRILRNGIGSISGCGRPSLPGGCSWRASSSTTDIAATVCFDVCSRETRSARAGTDAAPVARTRPRPRYQVVLGNALVLAAWLPLSVWRRAAKKGHSLRAGRLALSVSAITTYPLRRHIKMKNILSLRACEAISAIEYKRSNGARPVDFVRPLRLDAGTIMREVASSRTPRNDMLGGIVLNRRLRRRGDLPRRNKPPRKKSCSARARGLASRLVAKLYLATRLSWQLGCLFRFGGERRKKGTASSLGDSLFPSARAQHTPFGGTSK